MFFSGMKACSGVLVFFSTDSSGAMTDAVGPYRCGGAVVLIVAQYLVPYVEGRLADALGRKPYL
jgi:hypothetical protein